jgi:hypothetical protein
MNIALVLQHKLLLGIQRFMTGGARPMQPVPVHVRSQAPSRAVYMPRTMAARSTGAGAVATRNLAEKAMPLRVLRVVESGMPRCSTGRLVISGRMADVCAELDRLVEREAALH